MPLAETWMDLETVIGRKINPREKQISYINTHTYIYGIKKNGRNELICKAEIETRM